MKSIINPMVMLGAAGIIAAALPSCGSKAQQEQLYEKTVSFPADATLEQKVDMAARLVPTAKQMAWQEMGMTAFMHFGMNTFTDREWGDGSEDPALFNPTDLDTDQWVKTLKDAGFKMVLLTAKHHDGFCLWPTATTEHSVKNSPWLDGKGDVVRMLRESCDKYGMRMGVYLSPWDRNAKCYGDSPAYNDMFVAQLTELLSNYGTIDEVWFDGACGEGPNGRKQEYDWARFKETIETLQPEAVMAIMGDDVRWVGNEGGKGRETEWSATALMPGILPGSDEYNSSLGIDNLSKDLGSRDLLAKTDRLFWWPSEVDVSIRPGWFYHDTEDPRSLLQLATIYMESVGRNSVLLLNVPPDREGKINQKDVERLGELAQWIESNFSNNMVQPSQQGPAYALVPGSRLNCIEIAEDITRGQRVEEFSVSAYIPQKGWTEVADGTTVGYKRLLTFNDIEADSLRLDVNSFRGSHHNATINGAYRIEMPRGTAYTPRGVKRADLSQAKVSGYTPASAIIDQDVATIAIAPDTTALIIELPAATDLAGFAYMPPAENGTPGTVTNYECYTAYAPGEWTKIDLSGEFSNVVNNPIEQYVRFPETVKARYVRFVPKATSLGSTGTAAIAGFSLLQPEKK